MTAIQPIRTGLANSGRLKITLLILALASIASTLVFTTVLSDRPSAELWGFLVANFIFLLGLSQYGVAFSAIMRICGAGWARAYYRVAECFTLAFMPIAIGGFLYIYCFGSEHIFYWLEPAADAHHSPWLDHDSLLYRNLVAQLVFYLNAGIYFLMGLLPDITGGATYFHANTIDPPPFLEGATVSAVIGNHIFYKDVDLSRPLRANNAS